MFVYELSGLYECACTEYTPEEEVVNLLMSGGDKRKTEAKASTKKEGSFKCTWKKTTVRKGWY